KALDKEPRNRYQSAREFAQSLDSLASGDLLAPRPEKPVLTGDTEVLRRNSKNGRPRTRTGRRLGRPRYYFYLALVLLLGSGFVMIVFLSRYQTGAEGIPFLCCGTALPGLIGLALLLRELRPPSVTAKNANGTTWLMSAAKFGDVPLAKDLLMRGARVNE